MKKLLTFCFIMSSISANAHGLKRLTTTTCKNEESKVVVLVKYDSSVSILGPVSLQINGEEVQSPKITFGSNYTVFEGELKNKDTFSTMLFGEKHFDTNLIINDMDSQIEIDCITTSKLKAY